MHSSIELHPHPFFVVFMALITIENHLIVGFAYLIYLAKPAAEFGAQLAAIAKFQEEIDSNHFKLGPVRFQKKSVNPSLY